MPDLHFGIDLGGTKIEGIALSADFPDKPVCRIRLPTESEHGYEHILAQIARLVEEMKAACGKEPKRIGFGTPGTTDPATGLLKNSNTVCLNGKPLAADLRHKLGCGVILANDANCFALAEGTLGAARGASSIFGVIMGTGVGGGIVINGRVVQGAQGIAGEWGHNILEPGGEPCYCGKRGCVETVLSGPALERFYFDRSGARQSLEQIVPSARKGSDAAAIDTLDRLVNRFGEALAVVLNIIDPEVVVLGGGIGKVDELYTRGVQELAKWVFSDRLSTRIVRPVLGDSAGVFGAAMLSHPD